MTRRITAALVKGLARFGPQRLQLPSPRSQLEELYKLNRAEAIERLKSNCTLFCRMLDQLKSEFDALPDVGFGNFDRETEIRIDRAARELRENGVAFWPGFFDDEDFLAKLSQTCKWIRERSDELNVGYEVVIDPDSKWSYGPRHSGRSRAGFPPPGSPESTPAEMKALLQNAILNEVVARAFKTKAEPAHVISESLTPTSVYEEQWWHIDRVSEQAKIMVLASHVGERNGPMKIIPGSHRFAGPRQALDFIYYREGIDFCDVSTGLWKKQKKDIRMVTGDPGDCVFFNTSAFHANGRADEGERLTATIYYSSLSTPRNEFLKAFHPGHHI